MVFFRFLSAAQYSIFRIENENDFDLDVVVVFPWISFHTLKTRKVKTKNNEETKINSGIAVQSQYQASRTFAMHFINIVGLEEEKKTQNF